MHRDLKLENLLLDEGNRIKLCDFGWCSDQTDMRSTFCGTYEYMAPELVMGSAYNFKVDVWSAGILAYELLHGQSPFRAYNSKQILSNIKRGVFKFKPGVKPDSKMFIDSCLKKDPSKRPSAG